MKINSYIQSFLQPLFVGLVLNAIFEIDIYFAYSYSFIAYLAYLAYQFYTHQSNAYYAPLLQEAQANYETLAKEYASMESDLFNYVQVTDNDLQLKNEGIASLMVQVKSLTSENELLSKQVKSLTNGEAQAKLQWELENANDIAQKRIDSISKQLATIKEASEKQVTTLNNELLEAKDSIKRYATANKAMNDDINLYKPVFVAREVTTLKQKRSALLTKNGSKEELQYVEAKLRDYGVPIENPIFN